MRYYGLNDYLPEEYPRNEWRKTKIDRKWLKKKPEKEEFEEGFFRIFFAFLSFFLKKR